MFVLLHVWTYPHEALPTRGVSVDAHKKLVTLGPEARKALAVELAHAGCDVIVFHIEAVPHPVTLARRIRHLGCHASIALNPPTSVESILPYLEEVDAVLVMSVMPGFGGQAFDPTVLDKVRTLRTLRPNLRISIDGGIKPDTAALAAKAGATQFVAGSAVFQNPGNYAAALAELAEGARRGIHP